MKNLNATFVSLFPESISGYLNTSIVGKALSSGKFTVDFVNLRDFATDNYKSVDDTPCGGGPGQLMRIDIVASAIKNAKQKSKGDSQRVILMDPAGPVFTSQDAQRLSAYDDLIFVCGRYEGIDSRVHYYVDESLSIGDFVLTCGELAASVIFDATLRYVPGVLGNAASTQNESHQSGLLEHSQYTRPIEFDGHRVPEAFLSGHHERINDARRAEQLFRTQKVRPDLFAQLSLSPKDEELLKRTASERFYWDKNLSKT